MVSERLRDPFPPVKPLAQCDRVLSIWLPKTARLPGAVVRFALASPLAWLPAGKGAAHTVHSCVADMRVSGSAMQQGQLDTATGAAVPVRAIDISEILAGMKRRKKLIFGLTLLFALAGTLFAYLAKPVYTSEAQVLVEYQDSPYLRSPFEPTPTTRVVDDRAVKSQVSVLESRDLALKILNDLNLIGTPEFDILQRGLGPFRRLKILLGFVPDPRKQTPEQRALEEWYKNLRVYNLPQTRVIVVAFTSSKPELSARIVNALVDAYVEQTREEQLKNTSEARAWLKKQIEDLRKKVVESEKAVERFRAKAGLYKGMRATLISQQLSELNTQITNAESERSKASAEAKAIREMIRKTGSADNSPEVLRSPLIQRLREQQATLERKLAELSTTYLENHPRVVAVRRELANLKARIRKESLKIAAALEERARIAASREAELRAALNRLKARAKTANQDEVRLRELEREAKANRALLETFLARYSEAATRREADALPKLARVISRGGVPAEPSFPKRGPIIILSTLGGFGLGLGLAFILEVMGASARLSRQMRAQATAAQPAATAPVMAGTGATATTGAGSAGMTAAGAPGAPSVAAGMAASPVMSPEMSAPMSPQGAGSFGMASVSGLTSAPASGYAQPGATPGSAPMSAASRTAAPQPQGIQNAGMGMAAASGMSASAASAAATTAASSAATGGTGSGSLPAVIDLSSADATGHDAALAPLAGWLRSLQAQEGLKRTAFTGLNGTAEDAAALMAGIGRALAMTGMKVAVIDADFELQSLAAVIAPQREKGLADVLAGRANFADVMMRDAATGLHVVQAGRNPPQGDLSLAFRSVIEAMEQVYDLVLLNEGEARYPARRESSVLPLVETAFTIVHRRDVPLAESLCAALRKAGLKHCHTVSLQKVRARTGAVQAG